MKKEYKAKDDYFVLGTECHLIPDITHLEYFPALKDFHAMGERVCKVFYNPRTRVSTRKEIPVPWNVEALIKDMDESGVDVCACLREGMLNYTWDAAPYSTNGWIMEQVAKYPNRLVLEANVGPIVRRGVKGPIWEMEYLVKEGGAKFIKVYSPEDVPLNDPRMWPFYEKAIELDVPLTIHMGVCWAPGQPNKYSRPSELDDVLNDFPDLKVIAYHMAYPFTDELNAMCVKFGNLYIGLSFTIGFFLLSPYHGYHLMGDALLFAGADRIVFGLDWPFVDVKGCVDYIKNFEMPDELCEKWGYPKLSEQDKRNILGLTLAKLAGIEPRKRV